MKPGYLDIEKALWCGVHVGSSHHHGTIPTETYEQQPLGPPSLLFPATKLRSTTTTPGPPTGRPRWPAPRKSADFYRSDSLAVSSIIRSFTVAGPSDNLSESPMPICPIQIRIASSGRVLRSRARRRPRLKDRSCRRPVSCAIWTADGADPKEPAGLSRKGECAGAPASFSSRGLT